MNTLNLVEHHQHKPSNLAWLNNMRTTALKNFTATGLPTTQNEDWKYTDVSIIAKQAWKIPSADTAETIDLASITTLPYARLVFVDGIFIEKLSSAKKNSDKIVITSLSDALQRYPQQLQNQLGTTLPNTPHSFIELNTAFLQEGAYIYVSADTALPEPIELLFITTNKTENHFINLRNVFVLNNNSQASIIETYISLQDARSFTNVISEAILDASATLTHNKILQESKKSFHIGTLQVKQQQNSHLQAHSFALGGLLVRSDTAVELAATHADCTLQGLYLAQGKQHIDHHTSIHHQFPHGTSREYYKGIIAEQARAVFNGKVVVALDAQKTHAEQTNKNLLLSSEAEIDTKPQLEIFADDVQCTHGAAIGKLDSDSLFYLRSRGLPEAEARHILIYAFIRELIECVPLKPLRDYLEKHIAYKM